MCPPRANDPAVSVRAVHHRSDHGGRGACCGVCLEQLLQSRGAEERYVTREQHKRSGAALEDRLGLLERMGSPKLRFLHGKL